MLLVMISRTKTTRKEGETELTPAIIESAALEIIQNANDILEMYGIEGSVISLGLGLHPVQKKRKPVEELGYELSFTKNEDFAFAVTYKHPKTDDDSEDELD